MSKKRAIGWGLYLRAVCFSWTSQVTPSSWLVKTISQVYGPAKFRWPSWKHFSVTPEMPDVGTLQSR